MTLNFRYECHVSSDRIYVLLNVMCLFSLENIFSSHRRWTGWDFDMGIFGGAFYTHPTSFGVTLPHTHTFVWALFCILVFYWDIPYAYNLPSVLLCLYLLYTCPYLIVPSLYHPGRREEDTIGPTASALEALMLP